MKSFKKQPFFTLPFSLLAIWISLCIEWPFFDMKLIPVSPNSKRAEKYFAKVDDEDYEMLSKYTWTALRGRRDTIYAFNHYHIPGSGKRGKCKATGMHRMIMDAQDCEFVDHRDGDGLNNQRDNLRKCTPVQNTRNRKSVKGSSSQYVGVSLHRTKRTTKNGVKISEMWTASITTNGVQIHIGSYLTEIEAAKARDKMAKKYHGEFAKINITE